MPLRCVRLFTVHSVFLFFFVMILNLLVATFRLAPSPALFACDEKTCEDWLFIRSGSYKVSKMKGWSDKLVSFFIAGIYLFIYLFIFFVILAHNHFPFSYC